MSDNNMNLGSIADSVRDMMANGSLEKTVPNPEDMETEAPVYTPPAGAAVNIGTRVPVVSSTPEKPKTPAKAAIMPEGLDLENAPVTPVMPTTDGNLIQGVPNAELRDAMHDMPEEELMKTIREILQPYAQEYRKKMLMSGLTPEEATEAVKANVLREAVRNNSAWVADHINKVDVVIDKSQEAAAIPQFTEEEREKMTKANSIRLVVIENRDLENVRVKKVDVKHKAEYLHTLTGGLAKYSVPMPSTGDYFTFRGAQIMQLATIIATENERLNETLMRKAQLLYDKFAGGTVIKKNEHRPNVIPMSFEEFCNEVAYADVDIGLFGILCAGQMEQSETHLTCRSCQHDWAHKYNVKTLLSMDGFSDHYKERADSILANSADAAKLGVLNNDMKNAIRYKSPFTGNMYDIEIPSIAKANRIFSSVDQNDQLRMYHSAIALYLNRIFVRTVDEDGETYCEVGSSDEEIDLLLDTLLNIPDDDNKMLLQEINDKFVYNPSFKMDVVCPKCGNKTTLELSIDNLVFQKAQDTYTVMT